MEVTSIGWICGGLILIVSIVAGIWYLFTGDVEEAQSVGCGGPGCLVVIVIYLFIAQPQNPFIVPVYAPPAPAISAPRVSENAVSRPDYLLSQPFDLELNYNTTDGSGNISWNASRWMPTRPSLNSKIEYEIFVIYPDNRMGPYNTDETSYRFDYLNAESTGGVRIEVKAVGTIRDGDDEYRYPSGVVKTSWPSTED